MKKLLFPIILLTILSIFSSQTYEQQSLIDILKQLLPNKQLETSLSFLKVNYFGQHISIDERGYYLFIEFLIRKSAHFIIFGLLGVSFYFIFSKWKLRFWIALFLTVICAFLDEYHQLLTGGRTSSLKDVLLDSIGALAFLLIVHCFVLHKNKTSNWKR